jgi:hypothetical protein
VTAKEKRDEELRRQRERLLTVKEYADVARQHPLSVYRRIREGRQPGVHRVGGSIRLDPPGADGS